MVMLKVNISKFALIFLLNIGNLMLKQMEGGIMHSLLPLDLQLLVLYLGYAHELQELP
jgi:hypothetical protein